MRLRLRHTPTAQVTQVSERNQYERVSDGGRKLCLETKQQATRNKTTPTVKLHADN